MRSSLICIMKVLYHMTEEQDGVRKGQRLSLLSTSGLGDLRVNSKDVYVKVKDLVQLRKVTNAINQRIGKKFIS